MLTNTLTHSNGNMTFSELAVETVLNASVCIC